jgi:ectoine utilization protein EutC
MRVLILSETEIRSLIEPAKALREVRDAFVKLSRGQVALPSPIGFNIPQHNGEVHVKGAYLHGQECYAIKIASGFYANPSRGLAVTNGMIVVFDAETGCLLALLFDNGYLTELRTGAAGALAADLLAKKSVNQVGIVGCGGQARYQLEALLGVRRVDRVVAYGRTPERAKQFARDVETRFAIRVALADSVGDAVKGSDIVVTVTPSRKPIVQAAWISPGMHITAVGSDDPDKQELGADVLAKADKIVADSREQCIRIGELHHACSLDRFYAELGEIAAGAKPGRESEDEITIADLTGIGIQDAAVANFVVTEAMNQNIGRWLES